MAGIKEFMEKMTSDEAFMEDIQKSADANELMSKIKNAGFDVTPEELANALNSGENGELSDNELDAVAGGITQDEWWNQFKENMDIHIRRPPYNYNVPKLEKASPSRSPHIV